ncbi:MAG: DUF5665 domain-containing protein [Anaeromicrobium sp.]|uniref:DUF5665 domain-containing protein n=1 Tax=Anaeromicrobium sp. TaxID=1929132 RepID=UPI0025D5F1B7|nr:DUF5665 domain-containing protein [Anaeromicrobium sp.]MCT4594914.1 DUF5665 domain-containing protein [Anaeromicrobium sp.]
MKDELLAEINEKVSKLSNDMEKAKIGKYVEMMENPRRILYINFMIGLARGLGTAIGLTVLAALTLYILYQFVDLPLIGSYIAKLIEIIENYK